MMWFLPGLDRFSLFAAPKDVRSWCCKHQAEDEKEDGCKDGGDADDGLI